MSNNAKKTEHSGSKKGKGAYYGHKSEAKKESNKLRREVNKQQLNDEILTDENNK